MEQLEIRTLGRLSVVRKGQQVAGFASRKAEALLVYLACNPRPHPRETLADLLWDDRAQAQAMANLRVVLSSLRKAVGSYLSITRATAAVAPNAPLWVDALQLQRSTVAAQAQGTIRSTAVAEALATALALYEGDFLAGFFTSEAAAFESWAATERERLHRLAVDGWLRLSGWHLDNADYAQAVASTIRLLQMAPLAEAAHRQLMEALARSGQRAEALSQYETCRELLRTELGVAPEEATKALYEKISADRLPEPTVEVRAGGNGRTVRHNLPAEPTPFYGRQRELAQIDALLADSTVRLLTITGVGGVGKTRLAYAAAERQLRRQPTLFADGIYAITLAADDSIGRLPATIADALDLSLPEPAREGRAAWRQLANHLQQKRILLILDNFEHLLDSATLLGELVQRTTAVRLLLTSRERLRLRYERVLPLAGFGPGVEDSGSGADPDPFEQLFLYSARRVRPDFELTPAASPHLVRLRELTGGLPLAVELAAAWVELLPLQEIVAEIQRDIGFLQTNLRDLPARQRSIRSVFAGSWRRLDPAQQAIFSRLSVFHGGFTRRAAQAVAGASITDLATLSAKSLLQYDDGRDRYQIHQLLQQFAGHKLAAAPNAMAEAHHRHIHQCLAYVEQCDDAYRRTKQAKWLESLHLEHDNIRASLRRALARNDMEIVGRISGASAVFWGIRGYLNEGRNWLEIALSGRDELSEDTLGKVYFGLGWLAFERGDYAAANNHYSSSYEVLKEIAPPAEVAALLSYLGHTAQQLADFDRAAAFCQKSLSLYRQLDDNSGIAMILNRLGRLAELQGNYSEAEPLLEESLALRQASGDVRGSASSLNALAEIARYQGRYRRAVSWYEESLAICERLGDRRCIAGVRHNLAHVALQLEDYARATTLFKDSLQIYRELENMEGIALCLAGMGGVLASQGELEQAAQLLSKSSALFQRHEVNLVVADRAAYDASVAAVHEQMEDEAFEAAWATGQHLSLKQAYSLA